MPSVPAFEEGGGAACAGAAAGRFDNVLYRYYYIYLEIVLNIGFGDGGVLDHIRSMLSTIKIFRSHFGGNLRIVKDIGGTYQ